MKNNKVSIIIRTKNEEKWISHCLKMIQSQTYQNYEIIIIDNNSNDSTIAIAKRFKIKKILKIKEFLPGKAINLGIKKSIGDFIVCLSAHCIPKNNSWLAKLLRNFKDDEKVAGVYGRQIPINYSSPTDKRDLLITFGLDKRIQIKDNFFHNANSMFEKSVWKKFPFDENVKNVEDRLWGSKIIKNGFKIIYEPDSIVFHHHGIHHNNKPERAQSVVSIIEKFEKNRVEKLPSALKPENLNIVAVIPFPNSLNNNKIHKFLLEKTIKEIKQSKYINTIYVLSEKKVTKDKQVVTINRSSNKITNKLGIDQILYKTLKIIEKQKNYPNSILFVNYDYIHRPEKLIDKIILEAQFTGSDTVFAAQKDFGHYWLKSDNGEYLQTDSSLLSREKRKPTYKALYGLGCLTSSHIIRSKKIIGGKIGIIPFDKIDYTFRIRDIAESNIKKILRI
tara:strand:+ start:1629 stop:2972 length:1344 start_codon:yes stop_codon:yes gene_type:complete